MVLDTDGLPCPTPLRLYPPHHTPPSTTPFRATRYYTPFAHRTCHRLPHCAHFTTACGHTHHGLLHPAPTPPRTPSAHYLRPRASCALTFGAVTYDTRVTPAAPLPTRMLFCGSFCRYRHAYATAPTPFLPLHALRPPHFSNPILPYPTYRSYTVTRTRSHVARGCQLRYRSLRCSLLWTVGWFLAFALPAALPATLTRFAWTPATTFHTCLPFPPCRHYWPRRRNLVYTFHFAAATAPTAHIYTPHYHTPHPPPLPFDLLRFVTPHCYSRFCGTSRCLLCTVVVRCLDVVIPTRQPPLTPTPGCPLHL